MKYILFLFALLLCLAPTLSAQKINRWLPVTYSNRVPVNSPSLIESHLWFNATNSTLYGYDRATAEWSAMSKKAAYGEMSISNDTSTLSFTNTTPAAIGGLTAGPTSDFTLTTDSTLRYDGATAGVFRANYSASISFAEVGIMTGYIKVGTSIVYPSRFRQTITTLTTERNNVGGTALITLNPGDVLKVVFAPGTHTGTDVLTVYECNLNLVQVNN